MIKKTVVITGGTNGIGRELVNDFLGRECTVIFTGRDVNAGQNLMLQNPGSAFFYEVDFGDLNTVKNTAQKIHANHGGWDLLITNAGAKIERPLRHTAQGFEWHFGVNYLANFYLSHILPSADPVSARLINVSSIVARSKTPTISLARQLSDPSLAYANSKSLNLLNRPVISGIAIQTLAAHPGFTRAKKYGPWWLRYVENVFAQSAKSGAKPISRVALDGRNGDYFGPRFIQLWGDGRPVSDPKWMSSTDVEIIYEATRLLIEEAGFTLPTQDFS